MTSIQDLMNQLGGMGYTPPSSYTGFNYTAPDIKYTPLNLTPYNFTQKDFSSLVSKKKKKSSGIDLFDVLSGTLGQPVGYVTSMVDKVVNTAKKDFGVKNKPWYSELGSFLSDANPATIIGGTAWDGLKAGGKEQWKDWTDGKLSWGDVPLVGALHGMDKGWKRGSDIMKDVGVKNRWGQVGGGLAADIALDPLTYLTFGFSAASKLSKAAEVEKVAELSKGLGMTGKFKKADDFLTHAEQAMKSDLIARNPNVSQAVIERAVTKKVAALADEIKTARNTTFNSHINDWGFSVPFTNKFAKAGTLGTKSLLHRSEEVVSKELVDNLLKKASFDDSNLTKLMEKAVQARYGVSHTGELTKTMYDDLTKFVEPILKQSASKGLPDVVTTQKVIEKIMPQEKFASLMNKFRKDNIPWSDVKNQLNDILLQTGHDPALRSWYGSHLAEMVSDYWKNKPIRNFNKVVNARKAESMSWAKNFLEESNSYKTVEHTVTDVFPHGNPLKQAAKDERVFNQQFGKMLDKTYNEMGDFKTNFEHWLNKKNIFDARTLATGDKFVNSMGDHIADAHSQRVGETARYTRGMDKIQKFIESSPAHNREQLMREAIYLLENHAPKGYAKDWLKNAPDDVKKLADLIRPVVDRIGNQEMGSGVLDRLRKNYFPHVVKNNVDDMKDIEDFMKRNKDLNGTSSKSKYNQERKSFQTLADADNYIQRIQKAMSKETDPDKLAKLQSQQERVAQMFDTNVVTALQRRIKDGVRAKSMKALQGKLSHYGMMKTVKAGDGSTHIPAGLTELSKEEAKKLGLGEGRHYIHPDVLTGMKRVDEVFTSEGMNKFVRHVSAIADIWRPLVTYYKPSHYRNNILGNVINNFAAGVRYKDYKVAGKLISGYRSGKLTDAQMKIMEEAFSHNVISGGFLYDAHQTFDFANPTKLEKIAQKVGNNKAVKNIRHAMGEIPDDISRLANFVNGVDKFGNVKQAAKQVRTYLFNYNELTNADRSMRVLVPFWNWTKRNVPLQMKLLMENPAFAMNNERFKQLFNDKEDGADWQKRSGIKVPFTNHYTSIPSPTNDLSMLLNPREFLGSLTPAGKIPLELMMNKKLFTGNPITYGQNDVAPEDLPQYLLSNMGIGGNAYDAFSGKRGVGESILNLFNPVTKIPE